MLKNKFTVLVLKLKIFSQKSKQNNYNDWNLLGLLNVSAINWETAKSTKIKCNCKVGKEKNWDAIILQWCALMIGLI